MGTLQFCPNADTAPSEPGAYLLQIDLARRSWSQFLDSRAPSVAGGTLSLLRLSKRARRTKDARISGLESNIAPLPRRAKTVSELPLNLAGRLLGDH